MGNPERRDAVMSKPVKSPCRTCEREGSCKCGVNCAPFKEWVRLSLEAARAKAARLRDGG